MTDEATPQPRAPAAELTPFGSPGLRAFGVGAGWVIAGAVITSALFVLDLNHNLFDWDAKPESLPADAGALLAVAAAIAFCWWLGRRTAATWQLVIAAIVLAWLLFCGFALLPEEELHPGRLLGRDTASPWWYRWGRLGFLALPAIVLLVQRPWRRASSTTGSV